MLLERQLAMEPNDWIVVPLDFAELSTGALLRPGHPLYAQRDRVVLEVRATDFPQLNAPARHLIADLRDLGYRVAVTGPGIEPSNPPHQPAFRCDFLRAA